MKKKMLIPVTFFVLMGAVAYAKLPITSDVHGSLAESFTNVEALKNKSEIIAEVQIKDADSFHYETMTFTLSEGVVKKVYKGELNKKDTIHILETGGRNGLEEYTFEGNKVFEEGDKAIVFLEKYEGPVAPDAYVIKGVYQGKFKIKDENGSLEPAKHVSTKLEKVENIGDLELE